MRRQDNSYGIRLTDIQNRNLQKSQKFVMAVFAVPTLCNGKEIPLFGLAQSGNWPIYTQ